LWAAACSSSSSSSSNASDASTGSDTGSGTGEGGGSTNCVAPGTPNNELGIGGYCDKASDCPGQLCTALFDAPPNAWFCSKFCAQGQSCGTGEVCAVDARGIACVPAVCFADGGVIFDAGSD
jgi:hypothetical protein